MKNDTDFATVFAGCFGIIAFTLFIIVTGNLLSGWVLSILWGWFIVPVFDVSAITLVQAIGLVTVASFLFARTVPRQTNSDESRNTKTIIALLDTYLAPLLSLLFGYIIQLFM